MPIAARAYNKTAHAINAGIEHTLNKAVRGYDKVARPLGLGIRLSNYDDINYAFDGGVGDDLRKKHYDKSLRLLWKAEKHVPFSSFHDCSRDELKLLQLAEDSMSAAEKKELKRVRSEDFRRELDKHYTPEQKQAMVNILSLIGHGEAYAWIVSNQLMGDLQSTGARAAMTMQVLEEAKHFVVLKEILEAFDCKIPRMMVWEYIVLENVVRQSGLEKFFGMNVVVEGIALSLFGALSSYPCMDFLRMFHLDESRHTGLPHTYFESFPMTTWQKVNPVTMSLRMATVIPLIPMILRVEKDLALLGIDVFEFAGSILRKILHLTGRVGFYLPIPQAVVSWNLNVLFNAYSYATRPGHKFTNFMTAETTTGADELAVEHNVFQINPQQGAA